MSRSQESFNKREVKSRKEKKRKEKEKKRLERKDQEKSGNFEDMLAYVDENGMIVSTPPDPANKTEIDAEDIILDASPINNNEQESDIGIVTFYNDQKGYGFIKDNRRKQNIFVHTNNCIGKIHEGMKVSYEIEKGPKGLIAVKVEPV